MSGRGKTDRLALIISLAIGDRDAAADRELGRYRAGNGEL